MERKNVSPRGTDGARVISVIRTKALRGSGTEDDPCRTVFQYWSLEGSLLAENDPKEKEDKNKEKIKKAIEAAKKHGWKLDGDVYRLNAAGNLAWAEDCHGKTVPEDSTEVFTFWELDPYTGASRHRGVGVGCFWTDWKGGID